MAKNREHFVLPIDVISGLSHFLSLDSVSFIAREGIDLTIANDFACICCSDKILSTAPCLDF